MYPENIKNVHLWKWSLTDEKTINQETSACLFLICKSKLLWFKKLQLNINGQNPEYSKVCGHLIKVRGRLNFPSICDSMFIKVLLPQPPLCCFQSFQFNVLLPFRHQTISEVQQWCWWPSLANVGWGWGRDSVGQSCSSTPNWEKHFS